MTEIGKTVENVLFKASNTAIKQAYSIIMSQQVSWFNNEIIASLVNMVNKPILVVNKILVYNNKY